jgi:hypothetical protein
MEWKRNRTGGNFSSPSAVIVSRTFLLSLVVVGDATIGIPIEAVLLPGLSRGRHPLGHLHRRRFRTATTARRRRRRGRRRCHRLRGRAEGREGVDDGGGVHRRLREDDGDGNDGEARERRRRRRRQYTAPSSTDHDRAGRDTSNILFLQLGPSASAVSGPTAFRTRERREVRM